MAVIEAKWTPAADRALRKLGRRVWSRDEFNQVLIPGVQRAMTIGASQATRKLLSGKGGLRRRTGRLARAPLGVARIESNQLYGVIGIYDPSVLPYAVTQEFGTKGKNPRSPIADITPKKGVFLAVPTDKGGALTPAGVHRYNSARDFPERLVFVPGRRKALVNGRMIRGSAALYRASDMNRVIASQFGVREDRIAAYARLQPVYLLMYRVRIKPTYFLRSAMLEAADAISREVVAAVGRFINRA